MVRRVCSSGPLLASGRPVVGCVGGGESRLRGLESELECGLVGGQPEVGEYVADLLLGGVDDLSCRGGVDGRGDVGAELLEVTTQMVKQVLGRKLGLVVHGALQSGGGGQADATAPATLSSV